MWRQGWAKIGCWAPASVREACLSCRAAMQTHELVQTHPTVPDSASSSPDTTLVPKHPQCGYHPNFGRQVSARLDALK